VRFLKHRKHRTHPQLFRQTSGDFRRINGAGEKADAFMRQPGHFCPQCGQFSPVKKTLFWSSQLWINAFLVNYAAASRSYGISPDAISTMEGKRVMPTQNLGRNKQRKTEPSLLHQMQRNILTRRTEKIKHFSKVLLAISTRVWYVLWLPKTKEWNHMKKAIVPTAILCTAVCIGLHTQPNKVEGPMPTPEPQQVEVTATLEIETEVEAITIEPQVEESTDDIPEPELTPEPVVQTPSTQTVQAGDMVYVPGFGWFESQGEGTVIHDEIMRENGNKVGVMG